MNGYFSRRFLIDATEKYNYIFKIHQGNLTSPHIVEHLKW